MGLSGAHSASGKPPPTGFAGPPSPEGRDGLHWELKDHDMDELTKTIASRGDLAHLALFLWASGASALLVWALREMAKVNQHFNDFVQEIASLNRLFRKDD